LAADPESAVAIETVLVHPFGDSAVLVELGGEPGIETSLRVQALARHLARATGGLPGWERPVPAANSVLLPIDPAEPGVALAVSRVEDLVADVLSSLDDETAGVEEGGLIEIPVLYGGPDGPDLEAVARMTGLSSADVVEAHAATTYTALFLGFVPGFAYLGPLAQALVVARRAEPRQSVPAGSVAIAGPHAAIYPIDSPGGWWILGRTSARLWDPLREPPAMLAPGARVRFIPERRNS
jgi:KipI family sensor histidine kinase inhibitor